MVKSEEYQAYLNSNEWFIKRMEKAREQHYTCQKCKKVIMHGFHIHHKTYKNFGNEPLSDLMFLCEECHMKVHASIEKWKALPLEKKREIIEKREKRKQRALKKLRNGKRRKKNAGKKPNKNTRH